MIARVAIAALLAGLAAPAQAYKVFVSNERGNTVTVLDSETWEVIAEFPAGNRPRGITISPDGSELYVCASDDDTVRVFDTETYEETHTLPSGPDPARPTRRPTRCPRGPTRSSSCSIPRGTPSISPTRTTTS
jgi:YVTN family beta-propeller protein